MNPLLHVHINITYEKEVPVSCCFQLYSALDTVMIRVCYSCRERATSLLCLCLGSESNLICKSHVVNLTYITFDLQFRGSILSRNLGLLELQKLTQKQKQNFLGLQGQHDSALLSQCGSRYSTHQKYTQHHVIAINTLSNLSARCVFKNLMGLSSFCAVFYKFL